MSFITQNVRVKINRSAEDVWNYVSNSKRWTASTKENKGLKIKNKQEAIVQGAKFKQQENVGRVSTSVDGKFMSVVKPKLVAWKGMATYELFNGIIRIKLPEGGIFLLENEDNGTAFSHTVYVDFEDSLKGKLLYWYFKNVVKLDKALHRHNFQEFSYFQKKLGNSISASGA